MDFTIVILIAYLGIILAFGIYTSKKQTVDGYLLNKRQTNVWVMTGSIITSIIGTGAVVTVVSEVYHTGISYALGFIISSVIGLFILAKLAPKIKVWGDFYNAKNIIDFVGKKYGKPTKYLIGIFQLVILLLLVALQITAVSTLLAVTLEIPYWFATMLVGLLIGLYTIIGGFKVDVLTDFIQFFFISFLLIVIATLCYFNIQITDVPTSDFSPTNYGGLSWIIGSVIFTGFAMSCNAVHWQRILSAKDVKTVTWSFRIAIPIIVILGCIIMYLGIASQYIVHTNQDYALFSLLDALLPFAIKPIAVAILLSVLISTIDLQIITSSTIAYSLIFKPFSHSQNQQLKYARLITMICIAIALFLGIIHIPVVKLNSIITHILLIFAPSIIASIYQKNISAYAAFYSIAVPLLVLLCTYQIFVMNTFLLTTPIAILIVIFYDRLFSLRAFS